MKERITTAGVALKEGKVLLAKRKTGASTSGLWEIPGGKNRFGESVEDTLKREFKEELGVEIEVGEEICASLFVNSDTRYTLKTCLVKLRSDDFKLSVHSEARYFGKEEITGLALVPSDKKALSLLAEKYLS